MKKSFFLHLFWILSLGLTLASCKKNLMASNESPGLEMKSKNQAEAGREAAPVMDVMAGNLQLTPDQYSSLLNGELLETQQTGDHDFVAVGTISAPPIPDPYINPCDQDWGNFSAYLAAYGPLFQSWANTHCRPMMGCWSGECISLAFIFRPNNGCENIPPYEAVMPMFQF